MHKHTSNTHTSNTYQTRTSHTYQTHIKHTQVRAAQTLNSVLKRNKHRLSKRSDEDGMLPTKVSGVMASKLMCCQFVAEQDAATHELGTSMNHHQNIRCHIIRVGQNHIYTIFWQEHHQIYGHIRCMDTVLANPTQCHSQALTMKLWNNWVNGRTEANKRRRPVQPSSFTWGQVFCKQQANSLCQSLQPQWLTFLRGGLFSSSFTLFFLPSHCFLLPSHCFPLPSHWLSWLSRATPYHSVMLSFPAPHLLLHFLHAWHTHHQRRTAIAKFHVCVLHHCCVEYNMSDASCVRTVRGSWRNACFASRSNGLEKKGSKEQYNILLMCQSAADAWPTNLTCASLLHEHGII